MLIMDHKVFMVDRLLERHTDVVQVRHRWQAHCLYIYIHVLSSPVNFSKGNDC